MTSQHHTGVSTHAPRRNRATPSPGVTISYLRRLLGSLAACFQRRRGENSWRRRSRRTSAQPGAFSRGALVQSPFARGRSWRWCQNLKIKLNNYSKITKDIILIGQIMFYWNGASVRQKTQPLVGRRDPPLLSHKPPHRGLRLLDSIYRPPGGDPVLNTSLA